MCNVYSFDVSRDFPRGEQTEKTLFIEPKVFSMIVRQTLEVTSNAILTENVNNKTKQNTIYVQIERF